MLIIISWSDHFFSFGAEAEIATDYKTTTVARGSILNGSPQTKKLKIIDDYKNVDNIEKCGLG